MFFTPAVFLVGVLAVTAVAYAAYQLSERRQRHALASLARQWQMHFRERDAFDLGDHVAENFPLPGAAEVRIANLIYGTERDFYRYIFTAEYTSGVVRRKRRHQCVVTFRERKERASTADRSPLALASVELPLIEQYRQLHDAIEKERGVR